MLRGEDRRRAMLRQVGAGAMGAMSSTSKLNKSSTQFSLSKSASTPSMASLGGTRTRFGDEAYMGGTRGRFDFGRASHQAIAPSEPGSPSAFQPASAFGGARPGFVFKLGRQGLGYYPDKLEQRKVGSTPTRSSSEARLDRSGDMPQPDFMPASRFLGAKPGYAFKLGKSGLGYYIDRYELARNHGNRFGR
mmetsp:Transcript_50038/g.126117  ORF Transcript_50038/g.126117 Transcript_50038/m.126117 type:complete len:191 (-) Transcript_50038:138-710(-)